MRRVLASALVLLTLGGCAYYNGMYNTKRLAGSARRAERDGRPFEANNLWGQVINRADSLVTRHPRSKVAACLTQYDHATAGHVLATVIAHCFNHRVDSAVAHTKPLPGNAADVGFAAGRTVEGYVADDHVVLWSKCSFARRIDDDLSA